MVSRWSFALKRPICLLTLATAAGAGLLSAWWLFPVGLLFWLVMVFLVANSESALLNQKIIERVALPYRFQEPFRRIEKVQVRMFNALTGAPAGFRRTARPVYQAVEALVDDIHLFCQHMAMIDNYAMTASDRLDMQQEMDALQLKIINATDEALKREYEGSLKSLKARQKQLEESANKMKRVDTLLSGTENDLNMILTDLIGLRRLNADEVRAQIPGLISRVEDEAAQIREFGRSTDS